MKKPNKENQNLEYKRSWRDEYIKWICGFANAKGGILYIGVDDDGSIVGLKDAKKLLEEIPNKARDILGIVVDVKMLVSGDNEYLEIAIEPYPYPVSYKGEYHYRSGSTKQELKGASLDKFLLSKQGKRWDGVPVPYIKIEDLDHDAIEFFKQKASKKKRVDVDILDEDDTTLVKKLHLIDGDYLKRAAILLFYNDPEEFITGSYIKIGYFKSNSELIYHDMVRGTILEQVDRCMDLIFTKYLKAIITYEGSQRVETFPLSQLAFREALINAIVHKDYGELTPIQISVYDDKLLIFNSGELPEGWSIETLKQKHSSKPYNPTIANVFFLAGYIESWGRGIEKIIDESKLFNAIMPQFRWQNGLWIEFEFAKSSENLSEARGKTRGKTRGKIIEKIKLDPYITNKELAQELELTIKGIEWQIQKLKELNLLKRIGSARSGYWEILD